MGLGTAVGRGLCPRAPQWGRRRWAQPWAPSVLTLTFVCVSEPGMELNAASPGGKRLVSVRGLLREARWGLQPLSSPPDG